MATFSNIGIKLITTGDESGTWGDTTNDNFSDIVDQAIAGVVTHNIVADADETLTVADGSSSVARNSVINFTSVTLSATRTITLAPNDLKKTWLVINSTTGGKSLTFKQGSAGATVTVPNGESAWIYSNGAGVTNGAIFKALNVTSSSKISTGELSVDNININGNSIISTNTDGDINLTPDGTGEVNISKVDVDSGAIDGTTIGGASAAAGSFTTLTATTLGGPLNANSQAITNINVDSGAIDGTPVGANSASTGAFTTLSVSSTATLSSLTASTALALNASKEVVSVANTGSGDNVLATSPTLTTPNLGTPSALTLTNATGLPIDGGTINTLPINRGGTGITSFGTGVQTALGQNVTGSGSIVLSTSPALTTPNLGTPSALTLTNATGLPIDGGTINTLPVSRGGSGATTLTGVLKGNGASAFTASNVNLASEVTGTLPVANGGTGATDAGTARSNLSVPSTTGSGASGTWGISITGNAGTATSATNSSQLGGVGAASYALLSGATFTGNVNAPAFFYTSDARTKNNVETIQDALAKVNAMRGVTFDWVNGMGSAVGVIAQEVQAVVPQAVSTQPDGLLNVAYGNLVGVLIEAIKELSTKVAELEKK